MGTFEKNDWKFKFWAIFTFFNVTRILSKKFWEMSKKLQLFGVREGVK